MASASASASASATATTDACATESTRVSMVQRLANARGQAVKASLA